ncbi:translation initiation factor IF-2 [Trypanosoma theileri]|uniref:Translation initiation factor IF-2 n=1 Tax=Trypanosoma theileri TaxID=67003 RepID=A0A1X0NVX3_9TRYP|nr:translation initiation factor IF-2 [Trypanosoma theileri]ORC88761.1 translation initiation factor IF-2 [Trypanosoma theileri]
MWRSRIYLLKANEAFYPLPSVMDGQSFVAFVRSRTARLAKFLEVETLSANHAQRSKFFDTQKREEIRKSLDSLLNLKERDVERVIWEQYKLSDERLVTCLVPYQLGANIIMSGLPREVRKKCVEELKMEEASIASGVSNKRENKFIQWIEKDVFVSTGLNYLRRLSTRQHVRIPIIALVGHTQHGKTTLLDALQETNFREEESRGITQSVRAFTLFSSEKNSLNVTFVDTPGQRIFAETRFHAQIIADFLLIVVSVMEGVQSQTYEAVKVALNVDRPVVVVLNKVDLFSNAQKASEAVSKVLVNLREAGLNISMIHNKKDLERLRSTQTNINEHDKVSKVNDNSFQLFAPMKKIDSNYKGSRKYPLVELQRRCVGVCISAKERKNLSLLWSIIELMCSTYPPLCYSKSSDYRSHSCSLQAVILESSKHLFDEEGFRVNKSRQKFQKMQDINEEKRQSQFSRKSISVRINSSLNAAQNKVKSTNPTSTNCLVLTVIVKEGCITKGVPFIADQTKGQVDFMIDALGNPVNQATPGMAVTIIDLHSTTGCPGVGIHLLSFPSMKERDHIFEYRRLLQWYVECFTDKLHLLRPRGMNISFAHLGDYGQLKNTVCLEYQLLYGPPEVSSLPESELNSSNDKILTCTSNSSVKSIAEYLSEKNSEEQDEQNYLMLESKSIENKVMMNEDLKITLEATWMQLQPQSRPQTQEAYEDLIKSCLQIGVLFKVDSWHSARMLYREIARLGTRKIAFHVIGMRFGELVVDDILFFGRAMKIVVCYRTPVGASTDLDRYLEINDTWTLQTDDISDVVLFLKWCAVELHKEHAPDDCGVVEPNKKSYFMFVNSKSSKDTKDNEKQGKSGKDRRLLITPKYSH